MTKNTMYFKVEPKNKNLEYPFEELDKFIDIYTDKNFANYLKEDKDNYGKLDILLMNDNWSLVKFEPNSNKKKEECKDAAVKLMNSIGYKAKSFDLEGMIDKI